MQMVIGPIAGLFNVFGFIVKRRFARDMSSDRPARAMQAAQQAGFRARGTAARDDFLDAGAAACHANGHLVAARAARGDAGKRCGLAAASGTRRHHRRRQRQLLHLRNQLIELRGQLPDLLERLLRAARTVAGSCSTVSRREASSAQANPANAASNRPVRSTNNQVSGFSKVIVLSSSIRRRGDAATDRWSRIRATRQRVPGVTAGGKVVLGAPVAAAVGSGGDAGAGDGEIGAAASPGTACCASASSRWISGSGLA